MFFALYNLVWQIQFFGIVLVVSDRMGAIQRQLLRSVRPPLHREAELEEATTFGGQWWVAEGEIRRLQRARLALHRVARLCGHHFGLALSLSMLNRLLQVVCTSYSTVLMVKHWPHLSFGLRAMATTFGALSVVEACCPLALCWACTSAADRAVRVGLVLNKIQFLLPPRVTSRSLQLAVEKLHFSAAGFFDLHLRLFVALIGTSVTYVIILVQLRS
ncbi:putative gustatory receptor 2a [Schistocerca piceifrons]|uniref:putative gustatory receptor 2a n=1 Tax=Schistocerca piceifrons TaxID=274613 RepID=UPI001F5F5E9D|nr:putative gustatory receptor 2a [Schistocerca piceifrons]